MGADGHINIFDYDKIVEHFGEEKAENFRYSCYNTYVYKIFGHTVMTCYHGDNMVYQWAEDIDSGSDTELKEMLDWIEENAQIATWEVWT